MASSSGKKVFSGAELTKGGFVKAPDHMKNVIIMLHEAGLDYVLEEPCKILYYEVSQFFQNARVNDKQSIIKSKVNEVKVKMNSKLLNKFLRMPMEEEESISGEDFDRALAWCDYNGKKTSAIKKNAMNEEAKFLSDIIGKVFLCKPGSHDHIAGGMFDLMTSVILRKKRNWGADLFRYIAGSLSKPSFGRIISLFLCQSHPDNFSMSKGQPLHHHKKIGMLTLERVKRKVPQDWRGKTPVSKKLPADEERHEELDERVDPAEPEWDTAAESNTEILAVDIQREPVNPPNTSRLIVDLPAQYEGEAHVHEPVASEGISLDNFFNREIDDEIARIRLQRSNVASTFAHASANNSQLINTIAKMLDDQKHAILREQKKIIQEVAEGYHHKLSIFENAVKAKLAKFSDNLDHLNTIMFKLQDKHGKAVEYLYNGLVTLHNEQVVIRDNQLCYSQSVLDNVKKLLEEYLGLVCEEIRKGEGHVIDIQEGNDKWLLDNFRARLYGASNSAHPSTFVETKVPVETNVFMEEDPYAEADRVLEEVQAKIEAAKTKVV